MLQFVFNYGLVTAELMMKMIMKITG